MKNIFKKKKSHPVRQLSHLIHMHQLVLDASAKIVSKNRNCNPFHYSEDVE